MEYKIEYELTEKDILNLKFELYEKCLKEINDNPKYIKIKNNLESANHFDKSKIIYEFIIKHHKAKWNKISIQTIDINKNRLTTIQKK